MRAVAFILAGVSAVAAPVGAQRDGGIPEWALSDPFATGEHDPIGIDRGDGLEATVPTHAGEEATGRVPVQNGEVLGAIAGVREVSHDVAVRLAHGLAIVDVTMRFESSARYAAEVRYRLAVPEAASLADLEVCNARGCRRGLVDSSVGPLGPYDGAVRSRGGSGLPVAHAELIRDERGEAIRLRAAPVRREMGEGSGGAEGSLTLRVRYVVPAPVRGGAVRFSLPQRGRDGRAAAAQILVRSDELSAARVDGLDAVERAVERAADQPAEITARLAAAPTIALEGHRIACGRRSCVRLRAVAAPRTPRARDVFVLLDASPSTFGPARGRIAPAVAALLASMPSRARVRVAVFAGRAEPVIAEPRPASEISLEPIAAALERPLGSATRFESAWALIERWIGSARDPVIVLVGDGGITTGDASLRAFARARAAGAELASINVTDRATTAALASALEGGHVLDVGPEAERARRGQMDALEERLAPLFAPIAVPAVRVRAGRRTIELGPLRAGEELAWEGFAQVAAITAGSTARASAAPETITLALRDRIERAAGAPALRLAALEPESLWNAGGCGAAPRSDVSAAVGRDEHLILAEPRRCDPPADSAPGAAATVMASTPPEGRIARLARDEGRSGLPARSLLELLRQRIVPVARGCFRDDRAGRPNYQTRAVFEFRLADREVVDADVAGRLSPELRSCLLGAMDTLDIPRFDGTVQVRYPIYTAPELPPPTLSLDTDVADAVDAVAADDR